MHAEIKEDWENISSVSQRKIMNKMASSAFHAMKAMTGEIKPAFDTS